MVNENQVIPVPLAESERAVVDILAGLAAMGGRSNVRERDEREEKLFQDQQVGLKCEYAVLKYFTGLPFPERFIDRRLRQNMNPEVGDGGFDISGSNVDVKGSQIAADSSRIIIDYRLAVRPDERHEGCTYLQAFASEADPGVVLLAGWLREEEILGDVETYGHFEGAHTVPVRDLYPVFPFSWNWGEIHEEFLAKRGRMLQRFIKEECGGKWVGPASFGEFLTRGTRGKRMF